MSWEDRLVPAAYTSPGGTRLEFNYVAVSTAFDKKTSDFNFPDADGTYVQDLGKTGRRFPMRIFVSGPDYDLEAEQWMQILGETGFGKLEHPVYGTFDAVPTGSVSRSDDLVGSANQAVIEFTLFETTGLVYPTSTGDPASETAASVEDFNEGAAGQFADQADLGTAVDQSVFINEYNELLNDVDGALSSVADVQQDVSDEFTAIYDAVSQGITVLIEDPLTLAFQTAQLIQAPARAAAAINDRLSAYGGLVDDILGRSDAVGTDPQSTRQRNDFTGRDLFAMSYVTGSVVSVLNTQFETKTAAIDAAATILEQFDRVVEWRDENFTELETIDTGEAYQQLQRSVGLAAGFLVGISFSLKQERRIILTRDRTIIDLAAELYGSVDDNLDFLINSNSLTGDEILELPKGKEIVYYV